MKLNINYEKACIGFDWTRIPWFNREYLKKLYFDTRLARNCIKNGEFTNRPFSKIYPNAFEFKFITGKENLDKYYRDSQSSTKHTESHLLNVKTYYIAWNYD